MSPLTTALACAAFFFVADLVYAVDHYLVHHDRERYRVTHGRHHRRYNGKKDAPQLDAYELSTYGSAAIMTVAITSVLSLGTGNPGFLLGAVLKFVHTLLFHLYQHRWWREIPLRQQHLGAPKRTWRIASAKYHAFHHSHPDDAIFTYAESWAGFDRLLELLHPWLVRFTVDGAAHVRTLEGERVHGGAHAERAEP
ncbi:MAG TPA: sterol desaturase family protein [Labilithrix sp.]|nr:sterol desaturase family protein [Labilithrix sp.]